MIAVAHTGGPTAQTTAALGNRDGPDASKTVRPTAMQAKLDAYLQLLAKWNRVYNLTAIRDPQQMRTQHVEDALAVLPYLPATASLRLLDIGSGGGLPGLPLAIARPHWQAVLLDSNRKKGAFLQQAVIELALPNVEVAVTRIEDYAPLEPFDIVISRAFSNLVTFASLALPKLAPDGLIVAMKGAYPATEINALGGEVRVIEAITLKVPGLDAQRHLILLARACASVTRA